MKLRVLDLFSGIGGFSLGLERTGGFETVAFCEIEPFPRRVLAKHWPGVPVYEDANDMEQFRDIKADIITAGFPCQPASVAGQQRGTEDDRWLWPALVGITGLVKPTWCLFENVTGLLALDDGMVFEQCISDLEALDYEVSTFVVPACAVNAPHRRDRVWIVAHADQPRPQGRNGGKLPERAGECAAGAGGTSDTECTRLPQPGLGGTADGIPAGMDGYWTGDWEAGTPRVAKGIPNRVERLKALGNAVVPQVVEMIGYAILEAMREPT